MKGLKYIVPIALIGGGGLLIWWALSKGRQRSSPAQLPAAPSLPQTSNPAVINVGSGQGGPSRTAQDIALIGNTVGKLFPGIFGSDTGGIFGL